MAADSPEPGDHGVLEPGLGARGLEALGVLLGVLEGERIARAEADLPLLERALVDEPGDALAGADAKRVAALGTDTPGAVHLGAIDDLLARLALDPEAFGDDGFLRLRRVRVFPLPEPGHRYTRSSLTLRGPGAET